MLKTIEAVSPTKKRLVIEIPPEAIQKEISESLERLRQKTKLPGFRAGKAPMSLIEKRFGKDVEGEALQNLIPRYYSDGMKEAELRAVANPVFEQMGEFKRQDGVPFSMTLLVEVMPKIEGLNYTGLKVKDMELEADEGEVDEVLERLRQQKAVYEPSEEAISMGDVAVLDYKVEGEEKGFEAQVFKVGNPTMPEEFSAALVGRKKAESLDVTVRFPDDYTVDVVAGKDVLFHVHIKETKKARLPELDDEFAKDLGREGLQDLRGHIKEGILKSKQQALRRMQKAEAVKKLLEAHEFEAPESLLEKELADLVGEALAAAAGGQAAGQEPEDANTLREKLRPTAANNVRAGLLLDLIGEREKIEVAEEDLKEKISEISGRMNLPAENVVKYYVSRHGSLDALRRAVFEEKVLDFLVERAELEKVQAK